jgi:hypothetical protein
VKRCLANRAGFGFTLTRVLEVQVIIATTISAKRLEVIIGLNWGGLPTSCP